VKWRGVRFARHVYIQEQASTRNTDQIKIACLHLQPSTWAHRLDWIEGLRFGSLHFAIWASTILGIGFGLGFAQIGLGVCSLVVYSLGFGRLQFSGYRWVWTCTDMIGSLHLGSLQFSDHRLCIWIRTDWIGLGVYSLEVYSLGFGSLQFSGWKSTVWNLGVYSSRATNFGSGPTQAGLHWESTVWESTVWKSTVLGECTVWESSVWGCRRAWKTPANWVEFAKRVCDSQPAPRAKPRQRFMPAS